MGFVAVITLICPKCKRETRTVRESEDPPGTKIVHINCPKCIDDFELPRYFDKDGNELQFFGGERP